MGITCRRIRPWARSRVRLLTLTGSLTVALVIGIALTAATPALAQSRTPETIVTGLDNPRGLALLGTNTLAVAEAGHAGTFCPGPGFCMGLNGQVTIVKLDEGGRPGASSSSSHERQRTAVATGFPSFSGAFGAFGLGGLARQNGKLYFVVGLNPQAFEDSSVCASQPDVNSCEALFSVFVAQSGVLGRVKSLNSNAGWQNVAGVGRFDFDFAASHPELSPGNPEWTPGDADPFGLTAGPSGGLYVVDAASNTLDFVSREAEIGVPHYIPDPITHTPIFDAAPTCAAVAPNGNVYVATESNTLFRWDGQALTMVLSGGKIGQAVGCVADRKGNIYLANLTSEIRGSFPDFNEKPFDGSIVKVTPQLATSFVATGLNFPTGLTLGPDGDLYVALNGLCPKDLSLLTSENSPPGACPEPGKVVRFELD